jgi:pSer/pThr/pTyr-binding forkhead associated (FHA) protein
VVRLCDLDSTNGTFFGEERIRAAQLRHMSEFRVGSSLLLLTIRSRVESDA